MSDSASSSASSSPTGGNGLRSGYHDYEAIPNTDRCSICLLRDGDCTGSPAWDLTRPAGHYLSSTTHPPVLQLSGSTSVVLVHEDDYYRIQGLNDDAQRQLALINAVATDPTKSIAERLAHVLGQLERAGLSEAEGASIRDVLAWAAHERANA